MIKNGRTRVIKKKLWIVASIILIAALGLIGLINLIVPQKIDETLRSEAQKQIWHFNSDSYEDLLNAYSGGVGFQPEIPTNEETLFIFPFREQSLDLLSKMVEDAQKQYDDLAQNDYKHAFSRDENKLFELIKKEVPTTLQVIARNAAIILDFYDVFALPIMETVRTGSKVLHCEQTPQMINLLQSDDKNKSVAAEKFFEIYCEVANSNLDLSSDDTIKSLQELTHDKVVDATQALSACLYVADKAETSEANLKQLIERLSE